MEKELDRITIKQFMDYVKERLVEQIDHFQKSTILVWMHYLPHKDVVREDQDIATLGIVFDALAKIRNEPLLNDMFIADHIY